MEELNRHVVAVSSDRITVYYFNDRLINVDEFIDLENIAFLTAMHNDHRPFEVYYTDMKNIVGLN
jgi:hypothetical protein